MTKSNRGRQLSFESDRVWLERFNSVSSLLYIFVALIVVTATFATLGGAGVLSYDDPLMVSENSVVQQGLTADGVNYALTDTTINLWHPLTHARMASVRRLGRRSPGSPTVRIWPPLLADGYRPQQK